MLFIEAQFKYCPISWTFCSQSCSNKINKLHERALRLVYDHQSIYQYMSVYHQDIKKTYDSGMIP